MINNKDDIVLNFKNGSKIEIIDKHKNYRGASAINKKDHRIPIIQTRGWYINNKSFCIDVWGMSIDEYNELIS